MAVLVPPEHAAYTGSCRIGEVCAAQQRGRRWSRSGVGRRAGPVFAAAFGCRAGGRRLGSAHDHDAEPRRSRDRPRLRLRPLRSALRFLSEHGASIRRSSASRRRSACRPRISSALFVRWGRAVAQGVFLQAVTLDRAKRLLEASERARCGAGARLSGPSRLHDLFVTHVGCRRRVQVARDGAWRWSTASTPRPSACDRHGEPARLCALASPTRTASRPAIADLTGRFPAAEHRRDDAATAATGAPVFDHALCARTSRCACILIGTDFEIRVWESLMSIPLGRATTYSDIAPGCVRRRPRVRSAPRSAATRSPSSCPVIASSAAPARSPGYHWGLTRKQAMLGWEPAAPADPRSERCGVREDRVGARPSSRRPPHADQTRQDRRRRAPALDRAHEDARRRTIGHGMDRHHRAGAELVPSATKTSPSCSARRISVMVPAGLEAASRPPRPTRSTAPRRPASPGRARRMPARDGGGIVERRVATRCRKPRMDSRPVASPSRRRVRAVQAARWRGPHPRGRRRSRCRSRATPGTRAARQSPIAPTPQPMSRTRAPGVAGTAAAARTASSPDRKPSRAGAGHTPAEQPVLGQRVVHGRSSAA